MTKNFSTRILIARHATIGPAGRYLTPSAPGGDNPAFPHFSKCSRGRREPRNEAHLSAEQQAPPQDTWLPHAYEYAGRPHRSQAPAGQGPPAAGGVTGDNRFRPLDRIRRRSEYQTIYHEGRRIPSGKFILFVMRNGLGRPRLGITMTKRVGGAVRRNRAKRLLREIFRKHKSEWKCVDIVVNGRPGLDRVSYGSLEADFLKRLRPYRKVS